ncbi:Uncharacterised protein [Escherichia coli]|nr:Uncharacterised protein [Escherichia coli]
MFILAFKNDTADLPGADKVTFFVLHHLLVQVGRPGEIAGQRDTLVEPHMFYKLRNVYGVVLVCDKRLCPEMPGRRAVATRFKRQQLQVKEMNVLFCQPSQLDKGRYEKQEKPVKT